VTGEELYDAWATFMVARGRPVVTWSFTPPDVRGAWQDLADLVTPAPLPTPDRRGLMGAEVIGWLRRNVQLDDDGVIIVSGTVDVQLPTAPEGDFAREPFTDG
jgi:hypothetical protein